MTDDYDALEKRMLEWAQNEEMVDQHFTQHGRDCYEVGSAIRDLRAEREALLSLLGELVTQVEEDVPRDHESKYLWQAAADARAALAAHERKP